ncbi:hypothetical protein N9B63_04740 [Akkermansiaceae bacterium]|nr:hypothetical protein [Akkermansiaceae bacterium]
MPDLRAYVSNCIVKGEMVTHREDGSWTRDHIQLSLDGLTFDLYQKREVIAGKNSDLKHTWNHTTDIVARSIDDNQLEEVKSKILDICNLLSFASGSRIWPFGYDFPDGSGIGSRHSVSGTTEFFRPVLEITDGKAVRVFIEKTWTEYRKLKGRRKLPEIIDYLVKAELPQQPVELKLLIIFVVLEGLKDTYAKVNSIPYARGYFRKISSPPRPNIGREPTYSFEELLTLMLKEVKMKKRLKRIIKLRNQIIHSGLSRRPSKSNWKTYENSQDIVREYILRLLNYTGTWFPYSSPNSPKTI